MNKDEVINIINEFLIDELEINPEEIKPEATFKEDLGIDSLDFVDIAVIVEKNFKFKVLAEEMKDVRTLENFYDYIIMKVEQKSSVQQ